MPPVPRPPKGKESSAPQARNRTLVIVVAAAAVVAVALIVGNIVFTSGGKDASSKTSGSAGAIALVKGIPQSGTVIGNPKATTTMFVFEDVQCPYCKRFQDDALPSIIEEYVRPGRLKLDWQGLAFIGPDSSKALALALAAGKQNRLWEVVGRLFEKQGAENSGWLTAELVDEVLTAVPGLDAARVIADASSDEVKQRAASIRGYAAANAINESPSFLIRKGTGQPYRLQVGLTADAFRPALDDALRG